MINYLYLVCKYYALLMQTFNKYNRFNYKETNNCSHDEQQNKIMISS